VAYYTLLVVFDVFGMSVCISMCVQIAELSIVYFTEYRHTQHHSATHLGYKFRLNISHHQACDAVMWCCVRRYYVK
jgi:lysylphosphatidylglycerol synthetase-like protein (DUF2156 family)